MPELVDKQEQPEEPQEDEDTEQEEDGKLVEGCWTQGVIPEVALVVSSTINDYLSLMTLSTLVLALSVVSDLDKRFDRKPVNQPKKSYFLKSLVKLFHPLK